MDYDDNDFQSQNFHLAGEGSNKYPPVLHPYALPKFDFDDSLNGHLRFDSLVETEVFLGIEGNEDNHWIEDYSRGTSGVVFSSSAAETCAISRHNNVWSEATSSESVEMLLKSVGQDDVIAKENTAKESDACDELGCMIKQMEPNRKHRESSLSKEETTNLQSIPSADETVGGSSALKENAGGEQPLARDASQIRDCESTEDGKSSVLSTASEMAGKTLNLRIEYVGSEQSPVDQDKIGTDVPRSLGKAEQGDSCSGMQVDGMDLTAQNTSADSSEFNNQDTLPLKNDIDDSLQNSNSNSKQDGHVCDDPSAEGKPVVVEAHFSSPISTAEVKSVEEGDVVHVAEPDAEVEGASDFLVMQSERKSVSSEIQTEASGQNVSGLCTDPQVDDQCNKNFHKESSKATVQIVHDSSAQASSSVESAVDPVKQVTCVESSSVGEKGKSQELASCQQTEIGGSKPEASVSPELREASGGEVDRSASGYKGGSFSSNLAQSSPELPREAHATGASESVSVALPDSVDGPTNLLHDEGLAGPSDLREGSPHVFVDAKQPTESPSDCYTTGLKAGGFLTTDKGIVSEAFGTDSGDTTEKLIDPKCQPDVIGVNESGAVIEPQEVQTLPLPAKEEGTAAGISLSAGSTVPKTSSDLATDHGSVSESEKGLSCETGGPLLPEKSDQCPSVVDACISSSKSSAKLNNDSQDSTCKIEVCPAAGGSTETEAQGAEGQIIRQKFKEAILKENLKTEIQKVSEADPIPDKDGILTLPEAEAEAVAECGKLVTVLENPSSPLPTSSKTSEHTQSGTGTDGVKRLRDQNVPAAVAVESQDTKGNNASTCVMGVTPETTPSADLSKKKAGNSRSVPPAQASIVTRNMGGSPSTPSIEKTDAKSSKDASHGGSKGTTERRTRRAYKAVGKETGRKGNAAKEITPSRQPHGGGRASIVTLSSSGTGQVAQSIEMQQYTHVETSGIKPFETFSSSVSSLPDLNSTASSAVFRRPFTDLQQVQLRAQIFVYGALIQGTAPDEAYMISAFGGPDDGRSIWENAWRACVERTHGQKALVTPETPLQSRSGARGPDQTMKIALQGKITSPSVGQASGKDSSAVNPIMPLSSPLWNMPTPRDTLQSSSVPRGAVTDHQPILSSLQPHQTPPVKNLVGHSTPWISPSPFRSPWVASPQPNAFDSGARFSVFPITETVKLMPVKESSLPHSGAKHPPKDPIVQSGTSSSAVKVTPIVDTKNMVISPTQHSTDTKPRKRKKMAVSEDPGQIIMHSHKSQTESVSGLIVNSPVPSVYISTPSNLVAKSSQEKFITSLSPSALTSLSPSTLTSNLTAGIRETEQRPVLSDETLNKLQEAKMHAEEAAALAAAALSHSEHVWKQMDQHKNSGLDPEIENRLASAAVAVAAAAAVAKSAAATANVASNAALQAKLMADEALASIVSVQGPEISTSDGAKHMGKATPASILKGDGSTVSSSSVLVAAREAARRRVEAATAAAKRAENMDAIVKAAELAAEAVSQAGKLVTMGDPLPLNELLQVGPDNSWKLGQSTHELEPPKDSSLNKESQATTSATQRDIPTGVDDHARHLDGGPGSVSISGKKMKGQKSADSAKIVAVVSETEALPKSSADTQNEGEQTAETSKDNGIKEGSLVEVFKEGTRFRAAWYSANVLSLKDGKAYVSYTELSSEQGAEKLREWVALQGEKDEAPKIRIARTLTAMPFEGTRKRRRAAVEDSTWVVGDRVDAWVHDSWWEGVITEKNKKDETTLTVHFPVQGETLTVKAWHLRPSLDWRDGRWVECSGSGGNHEGDTPNEKRPRLGNPAVEVEGKDKSAKNADISDSGKPQQPVLRDLADAEKMFNIGRSTRDENKPDPLRMKRTGLQKQGSKVIFGVPKPGKKRKFMEVSKHYVSGPSSKNSEPNEPVKFTKYLMPQSSGSRGWKTTSKSEPKEKTVAVSKPKVSRPGRALGIPARTVPQRNDSQNAAPSASDADAATDNTGEDKDSAPQNSVEFQSASSTGEATEEQTSFSSLDVSSDAPPSKKTSTMNAKAERASKGKLAPAGGRLAKIEENKVLSENTSKPTSDMMEPRRSNRRIQPTSRLLEGLQTSLIISKIPSVSHGKGHQSQNKSSARGK